MSVFSANARRSVLGSGAVAGLRDVVLLAGVVRTGGMRAQIGRPVFHLPLDKGRCILDAWRQETALLGMRRGDADMVLRVLVDRGAPDSVVQSCDEGGGLGRVQIQRDPFEYRGTGGALRDLAAEYNDDDVLLVANAGQLLIEPLSDIAEVLAASAADVSFFSHQDGTPSGVFLVRCRALRSIPAAGFVDLKEQALPEIARHHKVAVLHRRTPTAIPIRTLGDYTHALRWYHQKSGSARLQEGAFAEDWQPAFGLVEAEAQIEEPVRLHDSVVLNGGCVHANSVLVRSIVCNGGVVRAGQVVVDQIVTATQSGLSRS